MHIPTAWRTFLESGEHAGSTQARGRSIAAAARSGRQSRLASIPGRVLIMLPPGIDFVAAVFGVFYAGAIAIPTYPPAGSRADRTTARVRGMVADAGVTLVLSNSGLHARVAALESSLDSELAGVPWLDVDCVDDAAAEAWRDPRVASSALALLRSTSGSTATPVA